MNGIRLFTMAMIGVALSLVNAGIIHDDGGQGESEFELGVSVGGHHDDAHQHFGAHNGGGHEYGRFSFGGGYGEEDGHYEDNDNLNLIHLGTYVGHHTLPPKVIKIVKTVAVKVPVPYPVRIPHHIPYPVPVPQIIKIKEEVPVPVHHVSNGYESSNSFAGESGDSYHQHVHAASVSEVESGYE